MAVDFVLPRCVAKVVEKVEASQRHPGLQLDRLSPPGNQKDQLWAVERVCEATGAEALLTQLMSRREAMLANAGAQRFQAVMAGPLTLHLARASGLENAGIHLHPVYGFACLPGSGLKGMARSYAETVWLASQADGSVAWERIRAVFGWTAGSEKDKTWRPSDVEDAAGTQAGAVVFHDAWPTTWPRLQPDIVNNHHTDYYDGKDDPGDWEEPVPVYFLSVAAGAVFDFAVSPRAGRDDTDTDLTALALEWLQAALVHEGAGAKTNAGYGRFKLENRPAPAAPGPARRTAVHTLNLTTPAFFAGAQQRREDCDLRPATLRGLLRWWWRTMHAAHLDRQDLRRLETAVWGDGERGGALAVSVRRDGGGDARLFDYKDGFRPKQDFAREHQLVEPPRGEKATQGLFYVSYGMDEKEKGRKRRRQRWYIEPGARWTVTLSARHSVVPARERTREARKRVEEAGPPLDAVDVLRQGEAALWLLCRFGGAGSKARKGFGSFADIVVEGIADVADCQRHSAKFRREASLDDHGRRQATSSVLEELLLLEVDTPWRDWWFTLDQLGFAVQAFARKNAHRERKVALGLPRKIHGHQAPKPDSHDSRYAAPVHYHVASHGGGTLIVRMIAFPSCGLPDIETSRAVLQELKDHLQSEIKQRSQEYANRGTKTPRLRASPSGPGGEPSGTAGSASEPGERVEAVLLGERTKKGGWKAKHDASGLDGPVQNTGNVPDDAEPGQRVSLVVASVSVDRREMAFRWPTDRDTGPARPGHPTANRRSRSRSRRR